MDAIEVGRRVRAARCYAGIEQEDLAQLLGMSRNTLYKVERGKRAAKPGELREIAHQCGLPVWFLTEPWPRDPGPPDRRDRS